MKKLIENFKSLPDKTKKLVTLGVTLALVVALPLFIWAIVTQRFELRRFATGEPTPTPIASSVTIQTEFVRLEATNAYILADGKRFYANAGFDSVHSDPPTSGDPNYTTLEAIWHENGVEMRLFLYFYKDSQKWWLTEARIFNGRDPSRWITWTGRICETPLGQYCQQTTLLDYRYTDPQTGDVAEIHFDSLALIAFENPTPPPIAQQFSIKVRFEGVNDGSAIWPTATIRFVGQGKDVQTSPVGFYHIGSGIYQGAFFLLDPLPYGDNYTIYVKGEKHLTRKFCQANGQTSRCTGPGSVEIQPLLVPVCPPTSPCPSPPPAVYQFDFTGLALEPGDLPTQDGQADANDFNKIKSRLSILCSNLSTDDRRTADLDYNGCINIRDAYLMRKTLETKFDED